jgi:hypothetical protein
MAGIGNTTQTAILALIFNATAWANYADNAASTPQTNVAVALHTADPGNAGTQTTSESAYTSYARVSVARTTGGWTVSGSSPTQVVPVAAITFPAGTGGSGTVTNFSAGKTGGGATAILFSGTVTPNIVTGSGVTPQLTTATTITLD